MSIRERVQVTLRIGIELLRVRLLLEERLNVRQLIEILIQILEQVGELLRVHEAEGMEADIRNLTRAQRRISLICKISIVNFLPVDLATAVRLQILGPLHIGNLILVRFFRNQNTNNRLPISRRSWFLTASTRR